MDRKKTILIAVLINAGLLVLLFILALHREEPTPKSVDMAQTATAETKPLFNDTPLLSEAPLAQTPGANTPVAANPSSPALPALPSAPTAQADVVHQLPPLAAQEVAEPIAAPTVPSAAPIAHPIEVKVKKGDSLDKIAKLHHTTVDEIIRINQLPSSFLRVGQSLKLPAERTVHSPKIKSGAEKSMNDGQPEYYTVKVGDNPWTIAMKHHMKVDELLKINNITAEKAKRLKAGDRLRIR